MNHGEQLVYKKLLIPSFMLKITLKSKVLPMDFNFKNAKPVQLEIAYLAQDNGVKSQQ